jgi:ubiquinone/menaquinone biosynthesis C-methylase UbiE
MKKQCALIIKKFTASSSPGGLPSMRRFLLMMAVGTLAALLFFSLISAQDRREQREQPEKLLDIAAVKPGMLVGEAGAGDGFLTFYLSKRVGASGRVYANDIDMKSLNLLNERSKREGVGNITTVVGKVDDPLFPVKNLDLVIMIWAFHDFTERVAWLENAKKYLKEDAGICIFDGSAAHFSKEIVEPEAEQAGYRLARCEQVVGKIWLYELRPKKKS